MKKLVVKGTLYQNPVKLYLHDKMPEGSAGVKFVDGKLEMTISSRDAWRGVVGGLLHESIEAMFMLMGLGYSPMAQAYYTDSTRSFFMTHDQYQEVIERVSEFVADAYGPLRKAYKARSTAGGQNEG